MHPKPQLIFSILAEGGSLSISRIIVNGQYRFLTDHHEMDFSEEGQDINQTIGYASFEEAFRYISKFPWQELYLHTVHEDYRIPVLDLLMEVLNKDGRYGRYYEDRKRHEHEKVLGARIYQDVSKRRSYSLEDIGYSKPDKFYK